MQSELYSNRIDILLTLILWIRKFSRDFYFAIFSFSNYSRVLKFPSKHSCSRPFPWVEVRRSL